MQRLLICVVVHSATAAVVTNRQRNTKTGVAVVLIDVVAVPSYQMLSELMLTSAGR
jgi:hypothetical protein